MAQKGARSREPQLYRDHRVMSHIWAKNKADSISERGPEWAGDAKIRWILNKGQRARKAVKTAGKEPCWRPQKSRGADAPIPPRRGPQPLRHMLKP
jgi:hypothetical protein